MTGADLISKRTRNAFREELVGWTLAEITTEFDNEGFKPDHRHDPPVGGRRRCLIEQLYRRIDFADPRQVVRCSRSIRRSSSGLAATTPRWPKPCSTTCTATGRHHGASFKLPQRGRSPLQPLSAVAMNMTADQLHAQIERIHASIEVDPALAIGTAKELVETTCKTILADLGEEHTTLDLGDLVKAASKALKLLPDGVPNEAKGADAIKRTLRSLGATVAGLGEMRNLYGSGHGQDGRARGLTARHARLAVGAASTLAMFLFETHDARRH